MFSFLLACLSWTVSAETVQAPVPALTVMPRGRKKKPVAAWKDVAQLRTKFNQLNGAAPGSASASQPDQLTQRPQVLIGFCCHTFAVSQCQLEGQQSHDLLHAVGTIVAQTVLNHDLDVFVACGLGGSQQGLHDIGKEYKDVLVPAFGSHVQAEALLSSTAAWNLGRAPCKLRKIDHEVKQLSDGILFGAGMPMLAMWAFKVYDMTFENYGFLCIASLSVTRLCQIFSLTER